MTSNVVVDPTKLTGFAEAALTAVGLTPLDARAAAEVLVRTTTRGVESHGIAYLHVYVGQLEAGGADPHAQFRVIRETPSTALVDAGSGNGLAMMCRATELAISKARTSATATVLVRNSNHFGAAGHYALMCAEAGLIGLIHSNGNLVMQVPGARTRSIGNGVTAYGIPVREGASIVLDIALSLVAGGKVRMAQRRGEQVPLGWIVGPDGHPSQDPADLLERGGALLPIAAHKGYGLTVFGEVMAGVLSGAKLGADVSSWLKSPGRAAGVGHHLYVLDPEAFMTREEFDGRLDSFAAAIRGAPLADGSTRIYLPGEIEHEKEGLAHEQGLLLEPVVWQGLCTLAERLDLKAQLESARLVG